MYGDDCFVFKRSQAAAAFFFACYIYIVCVGCKTCIGKMRLIQRDFWSCCSSLLCVGDSFVHTKNRNSIATMPSFCLALLPLGDTLYRKKLSRLPTRTCKGRREKSSKVCWVLSQNQNDLLSHLFTSTRAKTVKAGFCVIEE